MDHFSDGTSVERFRILIAYIPSTVALVIVVGSLF